MNNGETEKLQIIDEFADRLKAKLLIVIFIDEYDRIRAGASVKREHYTLPIPPKVFELRLHTALSRVIDKLIE